MNEEHAGPYDRDTCHWCRRRKQGPAGIAGYQRRQTYANVGPWFDACEEHARAEYDQPKQFQKEESHEQVEPEPAGQLS